MIEPVAPGPHGPLANVLAVRGGKSGGGAGLEHREALIYTLGKAAELEHLIMLQYLFAAFSLKQDVSEGLSAEALPAVRRWRATLLSIGGQEMLHLALVQNLLTAVGAAPRFARPNFPMPAYSYPAGVRIELLPFGEAALRHFAFLERPEGMDVEDAEGFEAIAQAVALPHDEGTRSSRTCRSSTRSASSIGRSRPVSSIWPIGSDPSDSSSGRRTHRRPRSISGGMSSLPSSTSSRRDGRSTRSSSRARGPAASGATLTSGACWASWTSTWSSSKRTRASNRPGPSWRPMSASRRPASRCP